ncbi:hypothetical protein EF888_15535 [Silicimonas algicola]|uniref:Uncharacterized protein n=1 Tax=Silicimonas algicola TaxID=1826607 RepID=A0A316GFM6_9RHOB|nr:hypothetical protein [Silicimonas algicola]AZQ68416.1 hypothetical protein EF888_15535 [Silicimonas algicola]PWK53497.1 hypothetical protein C8D95_11322 [Silicimonas algicola]
MDIYFLVGLTSPLAGLAAFALLIRILRKTHLERQAMQQAYSGIECLRAGSDLARRRSRAMFSHRTYSRNFSKAA